MIKLKTTYDQYFDKYMLINSFRKIEYMQFERRFLCNTKGRDEIDESKSYRVRLQILQEDHAVIAKNITQLIFNIIFNVSLIKIKILLRKKQWAT